MRAALAACLLAALFALASTHPATGGEGAESVKDQAGREVRVPTCPRRVVCLAPSLAEIVFALDRGGRLAGVSRFSDHPPEALDLPRVGSYIRPDLERIMALRPDLCLAVKDGTPLDAVRRLESLGVPVYALDVRGLDQLMDAVGRVGSLLDAGPEARALVKSMRERIRAVEQRTRTARRRPRVLYQVGADPVVTVGGDTFSNEIIRLAGGENVAADMSGYPVLDMERIAALAPEAIVVTGMDRDRSPAAMRGFWSRLPDLPAVRHGKVFAVDSDVFDRPGPRVVLAVERLARLLHPELFPEEP